MVNVLIQRARTYGQPQANRERTMGKDGRGCYKTHPVKAVFRALPLDELNLRGHPEDLSFEGLSQMNVTPNPSPSP